MDEEQTRRWLQGRPFMLSGGRDLSKFAKEERFTPKWCVQGGQQGRESVGFSARDQRSG